MKKIKSFDKFVLGFCLVMVCAASIGVLIDSDNKIAILSLGAWGGLFLLFNWLFKVR